MALGVEAIWNKIGLLTEAASYNGSILARLAYLVGRSPIKSIQRGTFEISYGSSDQSVTVSAVNMSKAIVNFSTKGNPGGGTEDTPNYVWMRGVFMAELTSTTSIKFSRHTTTPSSNYHLYISWELCEFV